MSDKPSVLDISLQDVDLETLQGIQSITLAGIQNLSIKSVTTLFTNLYYDNETEKYNLKNVKHLELEGYHGKLCKAKFYRRNSLLGFKP